MYNTCVCIRVRELTANRVAAVVSVYGMVTHIYTSDKYKKFSVSTNSY